MELGRKEIQTDLPRLGECELSVFYFSWITSSSYLHGKQSHFTVSVFTWFNVTITEGVEAKIFVFIKMR